MIIQLAILLNHPLLAEGTAARRGKLIGLLIGSLVILGVGITLVIKNSKNNKTGKKKKRRR